MFSMMMIASSTTTPRHRIKAISDIMLMVMPIMSIAMIAPANATGSPIAAIVALRAPTATQRRSSTSKSPTAAFV